MTPRSARRPTVPADVILIDSPDPGLGPAVRLEARRGRAGWDPADARRWSVARQRGRGDPPGPAMGRGRVERRRVLARTKDARKLRRFIPGRPRGGRRDRRGRAARRPRVPDGPYDWQIDELDRSSGDLRRAISGPREAGAIRRWGTASRRRRRRSRNMTAPVPHPPRSTMSAPVRGDEVRLDPPGPPPSDRGRFGEYGGALRARDADPRARGARSGVPAAWSSHATSVPSSRRCSPATPAGRRRSPSATGCPSGSESGSCSSART